MVSETKQNENLCKGCWGTFVTLKMGFRFDNLKLLRFFKSWLAGLRKYSLVVKISKFKVFCVLLDVFKKLKTFTYQSRLIFFLQN